MKFVHEDSGFLIDTENGKVNSLVIENPKFYFSLLNDIKSQIDGFEGKSVISENNIQVEMKKKALLIDSFYRLEINDKGLVTKIISAVEKNANECHFEEKVALLQDIESFLENMAFDFNADIAFTKVNLITILKACGLEVRDEYDSITEKLLDYFELVREFDCERLFLLVNLRSFVSDEEMNMFCRDVMTRGYHIILLENCCRELLENENRIIIDKDLCEF